MMKMITHSRKEPQLADNATTQRRLQMNKERIAAELVNIAKEINSGENEDKQKQGNRRLVEAFIKENEDALRSDEYAFARMSLHGPSTQVNYFNVSLADLRAIAKVLK